MNVATGPRLTAPVPPLQSHSIPHTHIRKCTRCPISMVSSKLYQLVSCSYSLLVNCGADYWIDKAPFYVIPCFEKQGWYCFQAYQESGVR